MWENYKAEPIKPNTVKEEGIYTVKIMNVSQNTMQKDGKDAQYIKADCMINADGFPSIALFITEGRSFNSVATAFFDTFGIPRGDFTFNDWIGKKGKIRISLKKKGEFLNMVPTYLLDENGYVTREAQVPQNQQQIQQQRSNASQAQYQSAPEGMQIPDDIPF